MSSFEVSIEVGFDGEASRALCAAIGPLIGVGTDVDLKLYATKTQHTIRQKHN